MTFRYAAWLWLLLAIPFAALFLVTRERVRERIARRFVSERLRGRTTALRNLRPWALTLALAAAVMALAGPSRGFRTIPITDKQTNRVIVLDVSNSMLAEDVGTSRLIAAKAIAKRLLDAATGRVALVEFEDAPQIVAPLTNDIDAVEAMLDSIQAGEVGDPGSDFGAAIESALKLVQSDPGTKSDIVLISDGEEQGTKLHDALRRARERGVTISTILVGTQEGSTIPLAAGPLRDDEGNVVTTRAHPEVLQQIANATGGLFVASPFPEHALDALLVTSGGTAKQRNVRVPIDRYQWPLGFAFAFFLIASVTNRGAE